MSDPFEALNEKQQKKIVNDNYLKSKAKAKRIFNNLNTNLSKHIVDSLIPDAAEVAAEEHADRMLGTFVQPNLSRPKRRTKN